MSRRPLSEEGSRRLCAMVPLPLAVSIEAEAKRRGLLVSEVIRERLAQSNQRAVETMAEFGAASDAAALVELKDEGSAAEPDAGVRALGEVAATPAETRVGSERAESKTRRDAVPPALAAHTCDRKDKTMGASGLIIVKCSVCGKRRP